MTYIASPKYPAGSPARQKDCQQCLSSSLEGNLNATIGTQSDDDVVASGVEAGWEADEIREALNRLRFPEEAPRFEGTTLVPDPGLVPSSSV